MQKYDVALECSADGAGSQSNDAVAETPRLGDHVVHTGVDRLKREWGAVERQCVHREGEALVHDGLELLVGLAGVSKCEEPGVGEHDGGAGGDVAIELDAEIDGGDHE